MATSPITERLARWVDQQFGAEAPEVARRLAGFEVGPTRQSSERLLAAIAIEARRRGLSASLELARRDWRDVLVAAGLGNGDWRLVLDDLLGSE